jgi:hypothetical protein
MDPANPTVAIVPARRSDSASLVETLNASSIEPSACSSADSWSSSCWASDVSPTTSNAAAVEINPLNRRHPGSVLVGGQRVTVMINHGEE